MKKLWQKNWQLNKAVEIFETQDDIALDSFIAPFDILASIAHAKMLSKIGIITQIEYKKLCAGLTEIQTLVDTGKFKLKIGDEDIHTKIENFLTKRYGTAGKKIHTGRSRNDQVLTALRLFMIDALLDIHTQTLDLAAAFVKIAKKYEFVPMPGYTHMQRAMPSSVGVWLGSFTESLLDDASAISAAITLINQSPLGSAAGYGVPLKLNREMTARLLGFDRIQANVLYCQNSRGKLEAVALAALVNILSTVNRFANDLLLFTTKEFDFFSLNDSLFSGSSIMPQKRNLDLAELLRASVKKVLANYTLVANLPLDLMSGYNRDLQDCKKPIIESMITTKQSLKMMQLLIHSLKPNQKKLTGACSKEIFATHAALKLVKRGSSFRDAYRIVAGGIENLDSINVEMILRESTHTGATGNLQLGKLAQKIREKQKILLRNNK